MGPVRRVLRFEPVHVEDLLVWGARLFLLGAALWSFAAPAIASGQTSSALVGVTALAGLAVALLLSAVRSSTPRALRVVEACLLLSVALHVAGHVFGFYATPRYDSFVHGVGGFLAGVAALALVRGTELFLPRGAGTRFRVAFVALGLMSILGIAVEIVEFGSDKLVGTREQTDPVQRPLDDTMWDFISEGIGGVLAVLLGLALTRNGHVHAPDEAREATPRGH